MALLLVLAAFGCVTPIERKPWLRVETQHFELISGAGKARTEKIARSLELFRSVLVLHGVQASLEPRVPLRVYVFGASNAYARFRPRAGEAGFILPRPTGSFLVIDGRNRGRDAHDIALHEYVHFVLRNSSAMYYPPFYDEGLADFLSTIRVEGRNVVIGAIPEQYEMWLKYGSQMSMRSLMTAREVHEWPERPLARFYAQAWATAHFFHLAEHVGHPGRHPQMVAYLQLLNEGEDAESAWLRAFGADFESLGSEFARYVGVGELPYLGTSLDELEVASGVRTAALSETEKRVRLGELALALGRDWEDEAELWFRLALEANPGEGRAHAALAILLGRNGSEEAAMHRTQAAALAPGDPAVERLLAESWLATATGADYEDERGRALDQAQKHFERSVELDPEQVAAMLGLGRTQLARGKPEVALPSLRVAHERLPADREITLYLAQAEIAVGNETVAQTLLTRMPPPAHGDPAAIANRSWVERTRLAAGLPARPPNSDGHLKPRLEVDLPQPRQRIRGLFDWVEVKGRAGLWEATHHDVVIAIDASFSTLASTRTHFHGDSSGESSEPDTILRAELKAARMLLERLDAATTRVALVAFASGARVLAPLGTPEEALAALDRSPVDTFWTGTSLAAALGASAEEFFDNRDVALPRRRLIVLLSDGLPTSPTSAEGRRQALELADLLGSLGVPIHAYALGEETIEDPTFYKGLAERSEGVFIPVAQPGDVVSELATMGFSGLDGVSLQSVTLGQSARALRVFPDGSFDGFLPLAEGENVIEIRAEIDGGKTLIDRRTVFFERTLAPKPEEQRAAARQLQDLEIRDLKAELLAEMQRYRARAREKRVEIRLETDDE